MDIVILGIDLGKNVCSVVGLDTGGHVVLHRRMKRAAVAGFARQWSSCVVASGRRQMPWARKNPAPRKVEIIDLLGSILGDALELWSVTTG
jgi:hypothetical protein